jgi:zinc protease
MAIQFERFKLENGLNVLVVPDHRVPVVTHSVWYNAGAMDEVPGKTGIAHMTEHLMFKGTPKYPTGTMDKIVQRKGGIQNAFTSYDFTAYFQKVPLPELESMMDMEADRMENLTLTDPIFQPERKVVAEERKLTTESNPSERFFETVYRKHYAHHTYGHPVIGWGPDIQGYTVQDALNWYGHHYAPNNATLILVGDITAKDVRPMIEKTYGAVKPKDVPARVIPVEPAHTTSLTLVAVDKQVQVPMWHRLYRAPSSFQGVAGAPAKKGEATALWVLDDILGGGDTSRLYRELVVKQQLADEASVDYHATRAGEATFDVSVQPKAGVTLDKVAPAVEAVIADLLAHGITEDELTKTKTTLKSDEIYARDDSFTSMYRLGMWVTGGGDVAHFDDWQDELKAMTVADVNAVAHKYLNNGTATTAVLAGNQAQLGTLKPTE